MNLHGHFHNKEQGRFTSHNQMDVGIDGNPKFSPYLLEDVIQLIKENNKLIEESNGEGKTLEI